MKTIQPLAFEMADGGIDGVDRNREEDSRENIFQAFGELVKYSMTI